MSGPNWLIDSDKQHQEATGRQLLFAGHRQRYTA